MKTVLINVLRATFVSFEILVLLSAIVFLLWNPAWVSGLGARVAGNSELLKYLVLVPVAVFLWILSLSRKMFFPENDKKKVFQNWPDYQRFKEVVLVGLGFAFFFSIVGVATWIMDWKKGPETPFVLVGTSIIGSLVSALSMYQAEIRLNEVFNQLADQ